MKKIYPLAAFFILWENSCVPVLAEQPKKSPQPSPQLPFDQVRIGFGIAGEYAHIDAKLNIDTSSNFGTNLQSKQAQTGKKFQIAPCLELGATVAKDYYLGLVASWRYSGKATDSRVPLRGYYYFYNEFKLNHYADVLAKLGYKINPCSMIYGLIGPSIANWKHTTIEINQNGVRDQFKINQTTVGLGIGIGVEYLFRKKYAFSFDCTHHFHRPTMQSQNMTYSYQPRGMVPQVANGTVFKKVDPSYSTIAVRFTTFFSL